MALYFIAYFLSVGFALLWRLAVRRAPREATESTPAQIRRKRIWIAGILLLPLMPYMVIAVQTLVCKPFLFSAAQRAINESDGQTVRVLAFKVLGIGSQKATVYLVTPCTAIQNPEPGDAYGRTVTLIKTRAGWRPEGGEEMAWSDCGNGHSSGGNIFPPYPSKGDHWYY